MPKKVYAIKVGYDFENNKKIENKIVTTWDECLRCVKGVKGAIYKSFPNMDQASIYLNETQQLLKKEDGKYPVDCLHVYVDGSYNKDTEKYSYGVVVVKDDVIQYIESGAAMDKSAKSIRQIAGELKGAIRAAEYALEHKQDKVVIFHDYEGISHHATGFWERREESSKAYYKKMHELMEQGLKIIFVKVDSHTGDIYNELVDEKCKEQLGINSSKTVRKWLSSKKLMVLNKDVKEEIKSIAIDLNDNIEIVE